jgi:hypothetical protein
MRWESISTSSRTRLRTSSTSTVAGEFAKKKFGHEQQIDSVVDKIQDMIPDKPAAGDEPKPSNA